jgi:hypothetical protein
MANSAHGKLCRRQSQRQSGSQHKGDAPPSRRGGRRGRAVHARGDQVASRGWRQGRRRCLWRRSLGRASRFKRSGRRCYAVAFLLSLPFHRRWCQPPFHRSGHLGRRLLVSVGSVSHRARREAVEFYNAPTVGGAVDVDAAGGSATGELLPGRWAAAYTHRDAALGAAGRVSFTEGVPLQIGVKGKKE